MPRPEDGIQQMMDGGENARIILPTHVQQTSTPSSTSTISSAASAQQKPKIDVQGDDQHDAHDHDEMFGLYDDEDDVQKENADGLKPVERRKVSQNTKPTLRCASLPFGAMNKPDTEKHSTTSPSNLHTCASMNLAPQAENGNGRRSSISESGKPSKQVTEYYKKQNELLENFKNDSEQIEAFKKTRTRQRLNSSTSEYEKGMKSDGESAPTPPTAQQPVVEVDVAPPSEVKVVAPAPIPEPPVVVSLPSEPSVKAEAIERQALLAVPEEDQQSVASKDSLLVRHEEILEKEKKKSRAATRLALVTLLVNVTLMIAKMTASYLSGSISIISSLVDSIVDITSGLVLSISSRLIRKRDPYLYPRGRTRLEPLSLILISVIMGMASVQLIISSVKRIHEAYLFDSQGIGEKPMLEVTWPSVAIMGATILIKFALFLICQKHKDDPSIMVLAMDHRNDCVSNSVALACAWLGTNHWYYWDPIGAIIVSLYILYTWVSTGREHIVKLSGKSAKPDFINRIIKVCIDHDSRIQHLETVYVYHYGTKFLVEVHIVLDEKMPLREAHDISEALQINIESLPEVERAFVHTDYEYSHRPQDEHKLV